MIFPKQASKIGRRVALAFASLLASFPALSAGAELCKLEAYVVDPDPKGLNVRKEPSAKSEIVSVIPKDPDGTTVEIRGSEAGWLMITRAVTVDDKQVFSGNAWVFGGLTAVRTRFEGMRHPLRAEPGEKTRVVGEITGEQELKLLGCSGAWAKVQWKGVTGFLPQDQICSNPVTTCP